MKGEVAVPKAQTEGFPPLVTIADTDQQKSLILTIMALDLTL